MDAPAPLQPDRQISADRATPVAPGACARPGMVLAATILASAMAFIDGTVITIALPAIGQSLGAELATLQWVINGYTLMLGTLILLAGALGDRYGRRRLFMAGIALFAVASAACGLASDAGLLVAARVIQGVGAALLVPQSLALVAAAYPRAQRSRAIGLWAGASALTTSLGPFLGGLFIETLSWHWVFWINLPLAGAALVLAWRHVPESRDPRRTGAPDWLGVGLLIPAMGLLTWGLTELDWISAVAGLAVLALFITVQARQRQPMVPLGLFAIRAFWAITLQTLVLYAALGGILFLLPLVLIGTLGFDALMAALALLPFGVLIGFGAGPAGRLADRIGPRLPLLLGPLLVAAGCGALALGALGPALPGVLAAIALCGAGMALVVPSLTAVALTAAPDEDAGSASGISNTAARLAGLIGVALAGAVFGALGGDVLGGGEAARALTPALAAAEMAAPEMAAPEMAAPEMAAPAIAAGAGGDPGAGRVATALWAARWSFLGLGVCAALSAGLALLQPAARSPAAAARPAKQAQRGRR